MLSKKGLGGPQTSFAQSVQLPTVDIVIPCYNYARYLEKCVSSVLSQEGVNARILIIDDASSDETFTVGTELAKRHPSITYRRHEVNKGHIATYNEGLMGWSSAQYVVLLSADDLLTPSSLNRAVQIMEADRQIGMVYGRAVHFFAEHELKTATEKKLLYKKFSGAQWIERRCRAGYNVITSPEVVVRGDIQRKVGGYNSDLPHSGDLEMWLRIAAVSDIAYVKATPQAFYRVHQSSMQRTKYKSRIVDFVQRKAAFDSFCQSYPSSTGAYLNALSNKALAREALWDACRAYDRDDASDGRANELVEFAASSYPEAGTLPEYNALVRRKKLGAKFCYKTQIFIIPAAIRWVARWQKKRRWERHGV